MQTRSLKILRKSQCFVNLTSINVLYLLFSVIHISIIHLKKIFLLQYFFLFKFFTFHNINIKAKIIFLLNYWLSAFRKRVNNVVEYKLEDRNAHIVNVILFHFNDLQKRYVFKKFVFRSRLTYCVTSRESFTGKSILSRDAVVARDITGINL